MSTLVLTPYSEADFKRLMKEMLCELLAEKGLSAFSDTPLETQSDGILNVKQAAELLHMKVNTLYEKTSLKLVPHFKKGKKLYFQKDELMEWIKEGKIKTKEDIKAIAETYCMKNKF
jgi:excisionase family DNA binding protein